jgi:hypothetical protein
MAMPRNINLATSPGGKLIPIEDCFIEIGLNRFRNLSSASEANVIRIPMTILPDISDRKSVNYADESGIGRSTPFKSFQSSENRSISWTIHWISCSADDSKRILRWLRALESCTYPGERSGFPYVPPPICVLRCGNLLSGGNLYSNVPSDGVVKAVLKDYSVRFDTTVPWDEENLLPTKLDVDLTFDVVYDMDKLPDNSRILFDGY